MIFPWARLRIIILFIAGIVTNSILIMNYFQEGECVEAHLSG